MCLAPGSLGSQAALLITWRFLNPHCVLGRGVPGGKEQRPPRARGVNPAMIYQP